MKYTLTRIASLSLVRVLTLSGVVADEAPVSGGEVGLWIIDIETGQRTLLTEQDSQ